MKAGGGAGEIGESSRKLSRRTEAKIYVVKRLTSSASFSETFVNKGIGRNLEPNCLRSRVERIEDEVEFVPGSDDCGGNTEGCCT